MSFKSAKHLLLAFVVFLSLSSSATYALTPQIKDMNQVSGYAHSAVSLLVEKNIFRGDDNGNINPQKTITRAEIVTLLVRALDIDTGNVPAAATFKDVPKDSWAYTYVEAAYREGIVKGVAADRFGPDATCTREQLAALFIRALKQSELNADTGFEHISALSDKAAISDWAKKEVELSLKTGLMNGTTPATFSPQGFASREQAAVVIDRFLNDADAGSKNVSVVFNGDEMPLSHPAIIEGNAVLLPVDFFGKYFAGSLMGSPEEGIVCLELAWGYNGLGYPQNFLWFKAGERTAYKSSNWDLDPFLNREAFKDRAIPLDAAPVLKGTVLYLPIKDICGIVNAQYEYKPDAHTVTIHAAEKATYPNLQYALHKNLNNPYWGDAIVSGTMYQTVSGVEAKPDEQLQIGYALLRRNNGLGTQMNLKYTIQKGDTAPEILVYGKISAPSLGILDITDSKPGAWLITNRDYLKHVSSLTGLNPLVKEKDAYNVNVDKMLVFNYKNLPVTRVGTVTVDGREATKYVMHFDQSNIAQVINKSNFGGSNLNVINLDFNQQVSYDITLYLIGENIVRQEYRFAGQGREEIPAGQINVGMDLAIDYKNAGQKLPITLPDGRLIPAAE